MRALKLKKSLYSIFLISAISSQAEVGNSLSYGVGSKNGEDIKAISLDIDRVHLATLPDEKRDAILNDMQNEYGESKIKSDSPNLMQKKTSTYNLPLNSLAHKKLETKFKPLRYTSKVESKPKQNDKRIQNKELKKEAAIFYVKGRAGKYHDVQAGWDTSPLNHRGCWNGTTKSPAEWWHQNGRTIYVTTGNTYFEATLAENKLTGFKNEYSRKKAYTQNMNTRLEILYSAWDFNNDLPKGDKIYTYDGYDTENTTEDITKYEINLELSKCMKAAGPPGVVVSTALEAVGGGLFAVAEYTHRHVQGNAINKVESSRNTAAQEYFNGVKFTSAVGVKAKLIDHKQSKTGVEVTVKLEYVLESGAASGIRDFDHYCATEVPQHFVNLGYIKSSLSMKGETKVKVGRFEFAVGLKENLYAQTQPGKLTCTPLYSLDNSTMDHAL